MSKIALFLAVVSQLGVSVATADEHVHAVPEKLGKVTFPTSCAPRVQADFERAVALLHSFTYTPAEQAFAAVAKADPTCAMAHWGIAMTLYHPLWSPPPEQDFLRGRAEIEQARKLGAASAREREFIEAAAAYYRKPDTDSPAVRAQAYEAAMADVAKNHPDDDEAQIFHALALLGTASPADKTHAVQKRAVAILAPLYRKLPDHPGLAHYLIHANDSPALAEQGVAAARAYSKIAPSAPHALHMPSHIFTQLGYWDDSIASNQAARAAAREQGDVGEELHAMDYLMYAYLQRGRNEDAARLLADLRAKGSLAAAEFKVGYAATAMPVRYAIERRDWKAATQLEPLPGSAPHVAAIVWWARAIAEGRLGDASAARVETDKLAASLQAARAAGNAYWSNQVDVLDKEANAWRLYAEHKPDDAIALLRAAADQEDAVEKLPVTPGPIVPAREQLGTMLLEAKRPQDALREFEAALALARGRRGALQGAIDAAGLVGDAQTVARLRSQLHD
jgi:hypothetical protein